MTSRLRLESLLGYQSPHLFRGDTNFLQPDELQTVEAEVSTLVALTSMYADLPTIDVVGDVQVVPFVGIGFGAVRTKIGETVMSFPNKVTTVRANTHSDFAWLGTIGIAIEITPRMKLDLDWRYLDKGDIRTGRGFGRVEWRDGSRPTLPLDIAPTRAAMKARSLGLSIRFAFR